MTLALTARGGLRFGALLLACASTAAFAAQQDNTGELPPVSRPVVQNTQRATSTELNEALLKLAKNPRDVSALLDAGRAALRLGDTDAALGFFRRADQVSPGNATIKAQIGKALVRADKPVEAIGYYDDAERAGGDTTSFAGDRGLAYDLVGDNGTAQRWYKVALAHDPSADEVRMRYALSLAIGGDERGANALLSPLIQRQDRSAWRVRTFILAISGKEDEAVSIANATMPADLALAIAPYLRYMPRLTHAQQAAAANFGRFPRAADIGRDDESIRQYAATHPGMARLAAAPTPPSGSPAGAVASGGGKRRQAGSGGEEGAARLARAGTPRPPAPVQTPPPPPQRQAVGGASAPQPAPASLLPAPAPQPVPAARRPAPSSAPGSYPALIDKPSASVATPPRAAPPPPSDGPADFSSAFDSFHAPASEKRRTEAAVNLNKFTPPRGPSPEERAAEARARARKAKEEAARRAEERKKRANPARVWVQVSTGANKGWMDNEWRKKAKQAPKLFARRRAYVTRWNRVYRLLAGPFKNESAAQDFLNELAKHKLRGFVWTSDAGQVIQRIKTK